MDDSRGENLSPCPFWLYSPGRKTEKSCGQRSLAVNDEMMRSTYAQDRDREDITRLLEAGLEEPVWTFQDGWEGPQITFWLYNNNGNTPSRGLSGCLTCAHQIFTKEIILNTIAYFAFAT